MTNSKLREIYVGLRLPEMLNYQQLAINLYFKPNNSHRRIIFKDTFTKVEEVLIHLISL